MRWLFMVQSEEGLIKPFSKADLKTREGIARLILACALLCVTIAYVTFVVLIAMGVI